MSPRPRRTPIALFSALTRAVREEAMPADQREAGFGHVAAMAAAWSGPSAADALDAFESALACRPALCEAAQPFVPELRAQLAREPSLA